MNKNPNEKSDRIVYIIILIIIVVFLFNLKNFYNLSAKIKDGSLFPKSSTTTNNSSTSTDTDTDSSTTKTTYTVVSPVGNQTITCKAELDDTTGTKTTNVYLYYTDEQLKSIEEKNTYQGISDTYTNYIYTEKKKYETRKSDNLKLTGFSVVVTLTGTSYLETSSVVDLSKVELSKIKISDSDGLGMYGTYNEDITEAMNLYINKGFQCE